ncbi:MAG: chromosomal replication initiator protein DnaA [Chloroflexota bacterium]
MNPQRAWEIAHNQLEIQFDRASFDTWLKNITFLDYDDRQGVFTLGVHNSYALDMLQHRLYRNVSRVLSDSFGQDIHIQFELTKKPPITMPMQQMPEQNVDMPMFQYMARQPQQPTQPLHQQVAQPQWDDLPESELNPRFTFDRFIVNRANYMVYEAARAVADSPNGGYNPLMIYGSVGLGKTHLLQAIANDCRTRGLKIVYVPSEAFVNDLVMAIRRKQQAMFREKYRRADVLLVDDVQFIAGKESTQEEFFHTFNALYTFNKQIILASDRHPDELTTLEDRLRSRFAGGLIVDVQPPEFETRVAILEMWAQERGTTLDTPTLEMIADRAPANIRELEGVFNQIMAKVRFAPGEMTTERVERTLNHFSQPRNHFAPITLQRVLEATAQQFRMEPSAITGKRRTKKVNIARQVAMYVAREMTDASLPQIGDAFGGRTHSTVLHSCNKITDEMEYDLGVREHVERIQQILIGD